jgi:hypothetical protein
MGGQAPRYFHPPNAAERLLNRLMAVVVGLGLGPGHMRVLEVRGRTSRRVYALPVDVLEEGDALYLVAPRGYTQWVNAEAAGEVRLRRGRQSRAFRLRALADDEKLPVLKAYLERFRREVQRYFPVPAGAPAEAFRPYAERYPAFELRER